MPEPTEERQPEQASSVSPDVVDQIASSLDHISGTVERIEQRTVNLEQGQSRLEQRTVNLEQGQNRLEQGQETLTQGQNRLEQRTVNLEQGQSRLEQRTVNLEQGQSRLEQGQETLTQGQNQLQEALTSLTGDVSSLKGQIGNRAGREFEENIRGWIPYWIHTACRNCGVRHPQDVSLLWNDRRTSDAQWRRLAEDLEIDAYDDASFSVNRCDFLFRATWAPPLRQVLIVGEISQTVDQHNLTKVCEQRDVLSQAGHEVLTMLATQKPASPMLQDLAESEVSALVVLPPLDDQGEQHWKNVPELERCIAELFVDAATLS